jgi:hypothetical protein
VNSFGWYRLVSELRDPRHADLAAHVVALEFGAARRRALILDLADTSLLLSALRGAFGSETTRAVSAEVIAELAAAAAATSGARRVGGANPIRASSLAATTVCATRSPTEGTVASYCIYWVHSLWQ